ncbi:MAG: sodium:proton antiporter [Gemmatimonadetes bacterium]|nr:sodium:proton antiporter [Gemmatimonadota bacterium]
MNSRSLILAATGLLLFAICGPLLRPNADYLARIAVLDGVPGVLSDLSDSLSSPGVSLLVSGPEGEALTRDLEAAIRAIDGLEVDASSSQVIEAELRSDLDPPRLLLHSGPTWRREVTGQPHHWHSLLPPFVAILLALTLRKTIPALLLGVWSGSMLMASGDLLTRIAAGTVHVITDYIVRVSFFEYESLLLPSTWTPANFQLEIILFVLGLIGTVGIASRAGGIQGVMNLLLEKVAGVRSALLTTFAMGLAIFFDDYSNTLIVGNTMRPLTDRLRVSREKLAYIVDSTAAPVAGISALSTWVAYEVSMFAGPVAELGMGDNPYSVFLQTIPFRFYCLLTLAMVALLCWTGRDFGPMLRAERRARETGAVVGEGSSPTLSASMEKARPKEGIPARWYNAVAPIGLVLAATVFLIGSTGHAGLPPGTNVDLLSGAYLRAVLGNADSAYALFVASWLGFGLAFLLAVGQRILSPVEALRAGLASFGAVSSAIAILLLAWGIGKVCADLGTAHYLIALLSGRISPVVFPAGLFLISCLVSFSTGSSWSTMSIVLPNTVFLAHAIGGESAIGAEAMTIMSIGAVLEGSIFGDHCSPISDSTIISSMAAGTDHIDHVRTQLPYALMAAAVTVAAYLVLGFTL